MRPSVLFLFCLLFLSCRQTKRPPVDYVNPYIGNISHLLVPTFPTVHIPHSMLRFYPNRGEYTAYKIEGFPLNLVSHRMGSAFALYPFTGEVKNARQDFEYTYDQEKITPYSYEVTLDEWDTQLMFIPASHSGFFRLHYGEKNPWVIMLKTTAEGAFRSEGNSITGFDTFQGVKVYLYLEFGSKPVAVDILRNDSVLSSSLVQGNRVGIMASFSSKAFEDVTMRYGISYISIAQAKKNLEKDIQSWDEKALLRKGYLAWNKELSKIEVEGGTEDQRITFYTALYRCSEKMIDISEDGQYFSAWSGKVEKTSDTAFYTDDWVWDSHLALHPLQVLLNPSQQSEKITSYIRMGRQSGWMPTFPTVSGDAHCMNGNHSTAVILDAWNKGIRSFNLDEAYRCLKRTILHETKIPWVRGQATALDSFYDAQGYFPALKPGENETCKAVQSFEKRQAVAVTLAASYDDWCMAQMAKELGKEEDYAFFLQRSENYKKLFNSATGFYHPKDKSGQWIEPFDYRTSGGIGTRDYYDENNGWTYLWQPCHAFGELIHMMGGPGTFDQKLDQLFSEPIGMSKWQYAAIMPDASGMMGQFVMGNEPSMHIAYLYNLVGKPWKTQKRIRILMDTWFRNDLMGVPGDEDGGGLSAFYVFSAMGFYPITPGIPEYQLGSPLFNKVRIHLENGKIFTILAHHNSASNKYIQSGRLNGKEMNKPVLQHKDILDGGTLVLEMGDKPNRHAFPADNGTIAEGVH